MKFTIGDCTACIHKYDVLVKLPNGLVAATAVPGGSGWRTATLYWKVNSVLGSIMKASKSAIPFVVGSRHSFRVCGVDSPDHHLSSVVWPLATGRVRSMNLHTGLQHILHVQGHYYLIMFGYLHVHVHVPYYL